MYMYINTTSMSILIPPDNDVSLYFDFGIRNIKIKFTLCHSKNIKYFIFWLNLDLIKLIENAT